MNITNSVKLLKCKKIIKSRHGFHNRGLAIIQALGAAFSRMLCAESWGSLLRNKGCWKRLLITKTSHLPFTCNSVICQDLRFLTPWAWRWRHPNPSKGPIYLPVDKHFSEDCSDVLGHLVEHKSLPAKHCVLYKPARDFLQHVSTGWL